jgi:hypothetical protein
MPKTVDPSGSKSHGTDKTNNIRTDYGKDSSFTTFGKDKERGLSGFKGGPGDLSRSLSGGGSVKYED